MQKQNTPIVTVCNKRLCRISVNSRRNYLSVYSLCSVIGGGKSEVEGVELNKNLPARKSGRLTHFPFALHSDRVLEQISSDLPGPLSPFGSASRPGNPGSGHDHINQLGLLSGLSCPHHPTEF